jgi:hypothetical protein
MVSSLERARALLAGKPIPVSLFQPLESETVKQKHPIAVTVVSKPETIAETVKRGEPVSIPDREREGIMVWSGGLPASWAKVFSALHPDRPPEGLTREQWRERLDAILTFGDRYSFDLERLGWDAERLFAVGAHWQRLDERGIGWFVAEALAEGGRPFDQSTYIPMRKPLTKTIRCGGTLPAAMAWSARSARSAMPCCPPPEPCNQYTTGNRRVRSAP